VSDHLVDSWQCPACGAARGRPRFAAPSAGTEAGVDADAFRPSSDRFGEALTTVLACSVCGHGAVAGTPDEAGIATAYEEAADPVSLREEPGQVETADRALVEIEKLVPRGTVYDLGCWTGSFLVAAAQRGWAARGVEPSRWASERARQRGVDVRTATLEHHGLPAGSAQLVVFGDVLEHLSDPAGALQVARELLVAGGAVYVTVPDAGSVVARVMGKRWWSVLPMHLQYFTRTSLSILLERQGFTVLSVGTHAKTFSARYYAERLEGYSHGAAALAERGLDAVGWGDHLVSPDFHDRMAVIARRTS
jgi:SAM-dependent methyltransferase